MFDHIDDVVKTIIETIKHKYDERSINNMSIEVGEKVWVGFELLAIHLDRHITYLQST